MQSSRLSTQVSRFLLVFFILASILVIDACAFLSLDWTSWPASRNALTKERK